MNITRCKHAPATSATMLPPPRTPLLRILLPCALLLSALSACNDIPITAPPYPDPHFPNVPVIERSGLGWVERYPVIEDYWDVLGIFPPSLLDITAEHAVSVGAGQGIPFVLDATNNLLRWASFRERKTYQVEIVNTSTRVSELSFPVTSAPSPFLEGLFSAAAGTGATLNRWWISDASHPGYLYLEGVTATAGAGEPRAYVLEFRRMDGRERGKIDYWTLDPVTTDTALRVRTFPTEPSVLDTDAIVAELTNSHAVLCAPPPNVTTYYYNHNYVVTRDHIDSDDLYHARNGSQAFLLLEEEEQRQCFRRAYLFEIIPGTPPATTAAHRENLPPNMRYEHSQYDIAWSQEFDDPDATVSDLFDQGYYVNFRQGVYTPRPQRYESYPFAQTAVTYDDPAKIENGKLHLGYGVEPKTADSDCDPDSAGIRIFDFVDNCDIGATTENFFIPLEYKYGYLEIDFARGPFINFSPFMWLNSHTGDLVGNGSGREGMFHVNTDSQANGSPLRLVYNCLVRGDSHTFCPTRMGLADEAAFYRWESQFYGSELQLMEILINNHYYRDDALFGLYWNVNHYGKSYVTSGNARFFLTIVSRHSADAPYSPNPRSFPFGSPYTYGIEWTPEGYIVWVKHGTRGESGNSGSWIKLSTSDIDRTGNVGNSHQCSSHTSASGVTIIDGDRTINGVIPCGINHVPMHLAIQGVIPANPDVASLNNYYRDFQNNRPLATSLGLHIEDRFIEIEHIRLYKPRNNYSDIPPVYK